MMALDRTLNRGKYRLTSRVDRRRRLSRVGRNARVRRIVLGDVARRVGDGQVTTGRIINVRLNNEERSLHRQVISGSLRRNLAADETTPCLMALVDDLRRVLLVLRFTGKGELVLGLAIGDFVDPGRIDV